MGDNGSGTYSRTNGTNTGATLWASDAAAGTKILSTRHDTHDEDMATALTARLTKNGETTPTANLPMGGYLHTNVGAATARTHYARASDVQDNGLVWLGTSGGTANVQTASTTPAITAYATGQRYAFKASLANTGAMTLNLNALGAKSVVKYASSALNGGEIPINYIAEVLYNGTNFQLLNPWSVGLAPTSVSYSTAINTTSTTFVTATGLSLSVVVATGEKVVLSATLSVSHGTTLNAVKARLYEDSTALGEIMGLITHRADTVGQDGVIALNWVYAPTAGTYTYTTKWAVDAGTGYSRWATMSAYTLRLI